MLEGENGRPLALVKGAGDLATGVAIRLHRSGFDVVMTEISQPTPVRRTVAFAEAVPDGHARVEDVEAEAAAGEGAAREIVSRGRVAVLVDPEARCAQALQPMLLVDAILAKRNLGTSMQDAMAVVALGPGFRAGVDAHAVVETMRGHTLGRVIYEGEAIPNTGVPGEIGGRGAERVIRAPREGVFISAASIGDMVQAGQTVGTVGGEPVVAAISGVLRGLLRSGLRVTEGFKTGDVDPRAVPEHCLTVSDKALAVAGGVLEAACHLLGGVRFASRGM